ncbi:DUF3895 domain-containing protein [Aquibacillus koreensis]|uniref:DUF3895 domain-containing protein n=1 Tax=Aquibacillus koreensis TaxID=279446 RepID=A0A9X4AIE3_9BACI|nr:DUF3895 domain-containing protein [Aquibacillus koreensis]MCT2535213.1 DUF3895 domain-containing protein [Aquibacillus koreensis]MDC3421072.1 DUF3895 domain-containing protein [Aquibacillus koreensis]
MHEHLSQSERDRLMESLTDNQKGFIQEYLKRGRRTVFANVLATEKAGEEAEGVIAEKWEFEDYLDAGSSWQSSSTLYCECGRKLRYQYRVKNLETGELKKFGIKHFEEHTGIPPQLAKEIVSGIEKIDYEMDEILLKIYQYWTLADEGITEIPVSIEVPKDIQLHFDHDMPLLERQVRRLKGNIAEFLKEKEQERLEALRKENEQKTKLRQEEMVRLRKQVQAKDGWESRIADHIPLDQNFQSAVLVYLETLTEPIFRASAACDALIEFHDAPKDTYSSGKPRIFSNVCIYLEYLARQGMLELLEKQGVEDRIYKVVDLSGEKDK